MFNQRYKGEVLLPVREAIDLERDHPAGVWRRTSPPPVPVVAARHPALSFQASLKNLL